MKERIWLIDSIRGVAILMVVVFHFIFDLDYLNLVKVNYSSGFWLYFGRIAAIAFMLSFGITTNLIAKIKGIRVSIKLNLKRFFKLLFFASLISLLSYIFAPEEMIWFGILHLLGASLLISLPLVKKPYLSLIIGILVVGTGFLIRGSTSAYPALIPLGIPTATFATLDYYPFIPWLGVVLIGNSVGNFGFEWFKKMRPPKKHEAILATLGKNSLWIYLIHQPVLLGILYLI